MGLGVVLDNPGTDSGPAVSVAKVGIDFDNPA